MGHRETFESALTLKQACEYLEMNSHTFRRLYRVYGIPHHKVGKASIFFASELDLWRALNPRVGRYDNMFTKILPVPVTLD